REFSCIVLEETPGRPIALPPTEMLKGDAHFDYRAKYLPGIVRKETPIQLPAAQVTAIRKACTALFQALGFEVYARIDGFYGADGQIYLNDPNTTAGMNPSSFFFHQAAAIGLNPTQLLTFILRTSLATRLRARKTKPHVPQFLAQLDAHKLQSDQEQATRLRVGVIMGGFSAERHISVESGRNIYEKLASSTQYIPVPLFLSGTPEAHRLFAVPMHMLLKDNADDIHAKLLQPDATAQQALMEPIQQEAAHITRQYAGEPMLQPQEVYYEQLKKLVDFTFIALHGRPGEDGALQAILEEQGIPYNGSGVQSSARTIDKFETNQFLRAHGIHVADQIVVEQIAWEKDSEAVTRQLEARLSYPFIAKPVDEGCSAAVIKIKNSAMLQAYAEATFRPTRDLAASHAHALDISAATEFPQKAHFLAEALIVQGESARFLEITGGLLTHLDAQGRSSYEVFVPSEVLAAGEVLSLEEKFLAGEGQNITPARFHTDPTANRQITDRVKQDLGKVARLLNLEGYARIDAFIKIYSPDRIETWIIEVNSLPAMTPATCIFHQCALAGYKPLAFIQSIIQYGRQALK
ncbi:MAG: D-alanine--D-alanine ligase, partial [Bacteroidota bacterium]